MYVCMYMSVCNGFMTKVYVHSLCTFRRVPLLVCLSSRYDGRLRGETTTPGQRTRPEVQKMKDDSTAVKGEDLRTSNKAILFAH